MAGETGRKWRRAVLSDKMSAKHFGVFEEDQRSYHGERVAKVVASEPEKLECARNIGLLWSLEIA